MVMSRRIAVPVVAVCVVAVACRGGTDSATDVESPDPVVTTTSLAAVPRPTLRDAATDTTTPSTAPTTIDEPVVTETSVTPEIDDETVEISGAVMVIQQGNDEPAVRLPTAPSPELADNRVGVWWEDYGRYQNSILIYDNGFTRTRIGMVLDWSGNDQGWPLNEDTLLPRVDDKITEYAENGIAMVLPIHQGSEVPPVVDEFTQDDIDALLELTTFIVEHFSGRIEYYEIWNEFGNHYEVDSYVDLVEQLTARIKEIDSNAKVVIGSIPGDMLDGEPGYGDYQRNVMHMTYLWALIDAMDFGRVPIDGFSWHPFYDNIPEDERLQDYPQTVAEIKARASARGFTGEYFADEILWHTWDEPGFPHGPPVSKNIAAKYYLRTITEHRALDVIVTINTFFQEPVMEHIRNLNNVLAGAEPADSIVFSVETEEEVPYLRQYAFTLPDGAILLAVWRHGAATEYDSGVAATLTIPGVSADTVTGIDVVHGFEQPLVAGSADGDLVVEQLMVKDYPVFIRLDQPAT